MDECGAEKKTPMPPVGVLPANMKQSVCRCGGKIYVGLPCKMNEKNIIRQEPWIDPTVRLNYAVRDKEVNADRKPTKPVFIRVLFIVIILTSLVVFLPPVLSKEEHRQTNIMTTCRDECRVTLVESIPENLTYPDGSPLHTSVYESWMKLMDLAEERLEIASFYWTLTGADIRFETPSAIQGETVLKRLLELGTDGGIDVRIVQNQPRDGNSEDIVKLLQSHAASVRTIDFGRLFGAGVLHTKLWIVDRKHFFVGSANMDWRSLTQVKELGVLVENCPCLAEDAGKLFDVYWFMGEENSTVPSRWPESYSTRINAQQPARLTFNATDSVQVYLGSSPPAFCPDGRTTDLDAILHVITTATRYIDIAVMDYYPSIIYQRPKQFWPVIDDALRRAALDGNIRIRLLASKWRSTSPDMIRYLQSLQALNGTLGASIETRLFITPAFTPEQARIPYARVNHNKYMVTDTTAYIGTSNWSGDYFLNTGGVSIAITPQSNTNNTNTNIRDQLQAVFDRDWNSEYAHSIDTITY